MEPQVPSVLDDLAAYVNWQLDEGITTVEMSSPPVWGAPPAASAPVRPADRAPAAPRPAASAPPAPSAPAAASAPVAPPPPAPVPAADLDAVVAAVAQCTRCSLHRTRTKTVPGQGNPAPEILFIGEAPGEDEDRQGLAFVGRAGQLLTKMIAAMGYAREEVFIANILKCRPPGNRTPLPEEMDTCMPFLKDQIRLLKPRVIVALGSTAVKGLLRTELGISKLRGQWRRFEGIDLMPTYHPAYLLRNPSAKREVWDDLKEVLRHLGRPVPPVAPGGRADPPRPPAG